MDRLDMLGNNVLHWIGRRRDAAQLAFVRATLLPADRLQSAELHRNADGELPCLDGW